MSTDRSCSVRLGVGSVGAVAIALVAGLALAGCGAEGGWMEPGPEGRFRQFLMHWFKGEREAAYEMIAPKDRRRLERPLEYLEERVPEGETPDRHSMLVAGRVDNPYDLRDIDPKGELPAQPPDEDVAVPMSLSYHDGREGKATMVWTNGDWYVGLPPVDVPTIGDSSDDGASSGTESDTTDSPASDP